MTMRTFRFFVPSAPARAVATATVAATLLLPPGSAVAQGLLRIAPSGGEIGVETRGDRVYSSASPDGGSLRGDQWIRLPLQGVLWTPQLANYSLALRPQIGQFRQRGQASKTSTHTMAFDGSVNLLTGLPISAALHTHRTSGALDDAAGGASTYWSSGFGGTLRVRNAFMPLAAVFNRRHLIDSWRASLAGRASERDETIRAVSITGQSAKMQLVFERTGLTDRKGSMTFASTSGGVMHTLHWGRASTLTTMIDGERREGNDSYRRAQVNQQVHLQHTRTHSSDAYFSLRSSRSTERMSGGSATGYAFNAEPLPWLNWGVRASGQWATYRSGASGTSTLAPRLSFATSRARRLQAQAVLLTSYESQRQSFDGRETIEVFDERHIVDDTRTFQLEQIDVEVTSVVVRSDPEGETYQRDIDYRVLSTGRYVRIIVMPSSRIGRGTAVRVAYQYFTQAVRAFRMYTGEASFNVALGRVGVRHVSTLRRAELAAPTRDDALPSGLDQATRLNASNQQSWGRLEIDGGVRSRTGSHQDYRTAELRLSVTPNPRGGVLAALGANGVRTAMGAQHTDVVTGDASLTWVLAERLRVTGSAEHWLWRQEALPDERLLSTSWIVYWTIGRIDTEWRYSMQQRTLQQRTLQQVGALHRFSARVVRRF